MEEINGEKEAQEKQLVKNKKKDDKNTKKENNKQDSIELYRIVKSIFFVFCAIVLDIINLYVIFGSFLPKYFIFDLSIFLFLAGILFLIPKNWLSNIFFCLFLLPQMILGILELTLELTVNDYFVFNMLSLVKDAFTVFKIYYLPFDMIKTYLIFFIIVIPILISLKFLIKKKIKIRN